MSVLVDICYAGFCLTAIPYLCGRAVSSSGFRHAMVERLVPRFPSLPAPAPGSARIWVHGVSVGEVLAARPLVEGLLAHPGQLRSIGFPAGSCEVVISSTTPAGVDVAKRTYPGLPVFHFPFDFSYLVRAFLRAVRPSLVVLVEQELWPNFLETASHMNVPVVVVNGRMTEKAYGRYKYIRGLARTMLRRLALVCALDEQHARRFIACGAEPARVLVTGNMKYDAVPQKPPAPSGTGVPPAENHGQDAHATPGSGTGVPPAENHGQDAHATPGKGSSPVQPLREQYRRLFGIAADEKLILAGSTHPPEDEWLLSAFLNLRSRLPNVRLLLVPRHIERAGEIESAVRNAGLVPVRRSQLPCSAGFQPAFSARLRESEARNCGQAPSEVLILDTVGELRNTYHAADIVFIGGSLVPHGGQNPLEPAVAAKPMVFGPHMFNFEEAARLLLDAGAAVVAADEKDLVRALELFVSDPVKAVAAGAAGAVAVRRMQGATQKHLSAIVSVLRQRR